MKMKLSKNGGFSLIELMIALVIVSILAAIAFPSYTAHMVKTRRAEAKVALMDLSAKLERYYSINHTFAGATLANLNVPTTTVGGHYNLVINSAAATTYSVQANPTGTQATNDTACGSLTLNQLGTQGITGSGNAADCW